MNPQGETGWTDVVLGDRLARFAFRCTGPLTLLFDAAPDDGGPGAAGLALRLLAGIVRPSSGQITALGVDPARSASARRAIALLGDPVLLDDLSGEALHATARELAAVRGVAAEVSASSVDPDPWRDRRALADRLAAAERAHLVLVSHPERYLDPGDRDALFSSVRAALGRGARVVVATRQLDQVLALAPDDRAVAALVGRGTVLAAGPAHALPWLVPIADGTRVVRVQLESNDDDASPSAAARLASELLIDPEIAPALARIDPVSGAELRIHARDPRAVARAIGRRAAGGLPVVALDVLGAEAADLARSAP